MTKLNNGVSELEPGAMPIDAYEDYTSLDTEQFQLEALKKQNERSPEEQGRRFERGAFTRLIGDVLIAVPGVPLSPATIAGCIFPSEIEGLQGLPYEKHKRILEARVLAGLRKAVLTEYLQENRFLHQLGKGKSSDFDRRVYYRAMPLGGVVEVGERRIRGLAINWQEPFRLQH